jgi:hypothetical protein
MLSGVLAKGGDELQHLGGLKLPGRVYPRQRQFRFGRFFFGVRGPFVSLGRLSLLDNANLRNQYGGSRRESEFQRHAKCHQYCSKRQQFEIISRTAF